MRINKFKLKQNLSLGPQKLCWVKFIIKRGQNSTNFNPCEAYLTKDKYWESNLDENKSH